MAAAAPDPVLVDRFRRDLQALTALPAAFGVAVSGGPDSLALLLLSAAAVPGRVRAATVDHGLREGSAAEAEEVARLCKALGVPHRTLTAKVEPGKGGLQAAAREARYAALAEWMEEEGLKLLLTGHHSDDQAETLLMRLVRGSGVGGLAGVRPIAPLPGARRELLVGRPLLGWRREVLASLVAGAGIEAAADPSNHDPAFDRVRIRARLAEAPWLDPEALARSAACLAEADEALGWAAGRLVAERVRVEEGVVLLHWEGLPPELLHRLVAHCLLRLDGGAPPRGSRISHLTDTLKAGGTGTLKSVKASAHGAEWRFEPTPPRRPVRS
jgi:tRNA(Ile)-lysidine synthase